MTEKAETNPDGKTTGDKTAGRKAAGADDAASTLPGTEIMISRAAANMAGLYRISVVLLASGCKCIKDPPLCRLLIAYDIVLNIS